MNYENFQVAVRAIIKRGDQILLVSENEDYWVTPGGYVDKGEEITEALKREVKEELSVEVTNFTFVSIAEFKDKRYEVRKIELYFLVEVDGEIELQDPDLKVKHARYYSLEEVKKIKYYPEFLTDFFQD